MPTVSQAKNVMNRAVQEIVDRPLTPGEQVLVWDYFDSRCAYCDKKLRKSARKGHLDHLDPKEGNHLGNRVLACDICNGDNKRDGLWLPFLKQISPESEYAKRVERMEVWRSRHPKPKRKRPSPEALAKLGELEMLRDSFGKKCDELRRLVRDA